MTHPLSRIPILGRCVDERFLEHRRRSSSLAGIVTACLAAVLFDYRLLVHHVWSWDLLMAVAMFVALKLALMIWYKVRD